MCLSPLCLSVLFSLKAKLQPWTIFSVYLTKRFIILGIKFYYLSRIAYKDVFLWKILSKTKRYIRIFPCSNEIQMKNDTVNVSVRQGSTHAYLYWQSDPWSKNKIQKINMQKLFPDDPVMFFASLKILKYLAVSDYPNYWSAIDPAGEHVCLHCTNPVLL